jgi:hypothetical protein
LTCDFWAENVKNKIAAVNKPVDQLLRDARLGAKIFREERCPANLLR